MSVPANNPKPPTRKRHRRLNYKFVTVVIGVLLALALAGIGARKYLADRRQSHFIKWGDEDMAAGKYAEAADNFGQAFLHDQQNAGLAIKWGDAFYQMSATRPEALRRAPLAWEAALHAQPANVDILRRLISFHARMAEVRPTVGAFHDLASDAERITKLVPGDAQAQAYRLIAAMGPWLHGSEDSDTAAGPIHDSQIADLATLLDKNPGLSEAMLYLTQAARRRAAELADTQDDEESDQLLAHTLEHVQLALQKSNADVAVLFRGAQSEVLIAQSLSSRNLAATPTVDASTKPSQLGSDGTAMVSRAELLKRASASLARARQIASPQDPHFLDIRIFEADLTTIQGNRAAAESMYREALAQRPNSLRARLALATFLSVSHPDQAIAVLSKSTDALDPQPGPDSLQQKDFLAQSLTLLAALYVDAIGNSADRTIVAAQVEKAQSACDQLVRTIGQTPMALQELAHLQLIQGQALNALHTVDRGLNLIKTAHLSPLPELWRLKAYAFVGLHQQDQAVALLRAALRTSPDFSPNRLLFAKLLLSRGDVSEAAAQADVLEQQLGAQDPRVATLRLAVLNADVTAPSDDNRTRQIRELYGRLPEADRHQMALKARQALACGDTDDAIRLLQTICAADPTSATAAIDLSQVLAEHNHSDRAKAVIARALQAHPDDANLLMQKRSLEGASQADLKQFAQKLSEKNSDAFVRVLRAAQAALAKRDTAAAKVLLDAAEKLKPEDLTLVNLRFQWNLQERHWDAADECAQKLAKANFDQMGGLSYRFQIVVTRGDDTAATAIAREMTTSYGDFAGSWLALGQTLQGTSQYSKAIAAYQRAVAMQHDMLPAITGIASCLLSIGANGDALDWIRQATAIAPADAEVRDLQLRQQLTGGDPRALLPAREAAVRDEPDRWDNAVALARVYRRINVVEATSNPQASRDALQRALAILKQAVRQWPDVPTCYVWAASTMAQSGDVEGGVQILRDLAARAKWAHRPEPWLLLADYQQNYGSPAAAELALREAIKLGSSNVGTALKLSQEILEQGRAEQALAVLAPYIADLRVQQRRIEILLGMDRAAQAEAEVKLALKAVPDSPQLMTLMGMVYESRKDDAQATKWLDRAIAADNGILAHRVRGALRLRQPSVSIDKAIEDLQMAYQADPGDPESAMLLASAYARKQDGVQARAILQRSLALTPSDKRIRLSLVTLDKTESPPPWDKISKLIDQGRSLAAWDPDWLAEEARTWASRGQPAKGAAFMKQAVQLALRSQAVAAATQPASADALQTTTRQAADFVREQLLMLINSKDDAALLREADEIIARFGTADLASAWAYLGRAIVHHNPKFPASQLESDYDAAIAAAKAAGNATDCLNVVSVIADGGGPDAALRRISGLGAGKPHSETGAALVIASDPRWDVLRIELLDRKGDIPAAVAAADATLPRLSKFSSDYQILLLRASAEAYSRLEPTPQVGKARDAYLSLIQRAPEDRFALNNLAWLYLEQTKPAQPAQALIFSQRAYNATYRYGEFDPHVGDTHGWVLACNGRTDEAIQILTLVVRVLPEPGTYDHLAETYLIAGQPKAALANIELAIQLGARSQQARQPLDSALAGRIGKTFARVAVWSIFSGETPTPAQISNIAP